MKSPRKHRLLASRLIAAGCALGVAIPQAVTAAEVTEAEFKALRDTVQQLAEKVQKMEQVHASDAQTHQKDQEQIQQLQQQLGQAQATAMEADRKATAASTVQPNYWIPTDEGSVNRNS